MISNFESKIYPIVLILFFFIFLPIRSNAQLKEIKDFGSNPGNLKMYVYRPSTFSDTVKNIPMVIALHGCSQNAKEIHVQSDWKKLADENKFMVVYPQQKKANNVNGCFNWFMKKDQEGNEGELFSIYEMMKYCEKKYSINESKIFVYGLSAGAVMAVNLMANYPDKIKAGAILAGGPYKAATNPIEAMKVMMAPQTKTAEQLNELLPQNDSSLQLPQLIVLHGESDKVVVMQSSVELIKQWSVQHIIDWTLNDTVKNFNENQLVNRISYMDSTKKEKIIFYTLKNTGHTLPVDPGEEKMQGGKTGMFATDKDFFSTYFIAKDFGLIFEKK